MSRLPYLLKLAQKIASLKLTTLVGISESSRDGWIFTIIKSDRNIGFEGISALKIENASIFIFRTE